MPDRMLLNCHSLYGECLILVSKFFATQLSWAGMALNRSDIIDLGSRSIGRIQLDIWLLLLYNTGWRQLHIAICRTFCHLQLCLFQLQCQLPRILWATFDQFVKMFESNTNPDLFTSNSQSWSILRIKRGIYVWTCSVKSSATGANNFEIFKLPFVGIFSGYFTISYKFIGLHWLDSFWVQLDIYALLC